MPATPETTKSAAASDALNVPAVKRPQRDAERHQRAGVVEHRLALDQQADPLGDMHPG